MKKLVALFLFLVGCEKYDDQWGRYLCEKYRKPVSCIGNDCTVESMGRVVYNPQEMIDEKPFNLIIRDGDRIVMEVYCKNLFQLRNNLHQIMDLFPQISIKHLKIDLVEEPLRKSE